MQESLGNHLLIGVVDDDSSVRKALARLLRAACLSVEVFASAAELLAYEGPHRPACLILDIHLPDMDGITLLRRILAAEPGLPVVMVTGDVDPELRARALQAGAAAFLPKPLDEAELLAELHRALAKRSQHDEALQG